MTILSDDTVICLNNGAGGEFNTIKVSDLKALIAAQVLVQKYEGQSIEFLTPAVAPNGAEWQENQVLNITIQIEGNPAPVAP